MAGQGASLEGRVLYDADTIDANIGLPAFYRNIQISSARAGQPVRPPRRELRRVAAEKNFPGTWTTYLKERIPTWIEGKQRDFVPKMTTGRRAGSSPRPGSSA